MPTAVAAFKFNGSRGITRWLPKYPNCPLRFSIGGAFSPQVGRGRAETASAMYFAVLCQTACMKLRCAGRSNYQRNE